jgi:hypothetical protein
MMLSMKERSLAGEFRKGDCPGLAREEDLTWKQCLVGDGRLN